MAPGLFRGVVRRDREEFPFLLAGLGIEGEDRAAIGPLAALGADHHHVLAGDEERRAGEAHGELLHIVAVDLIEGAEMVGAPRAVICRPVVVGGAVERYGLRRRRRRLRGGLRFLGAARQQTGDAEQGSNEYSPGTLAYHVAP